MKTINDLLQMKENTIEIFGNEYDFFFSRLEEYYISKLDGKERIKKELEEWDEESKNFILSNLADMISETGLLNFDRNEIISLTKG